MDGFRADEALVGLIALGSILWIVSLLRRGSKTGRLPIGRGQLLKAERPGAYQALFGFYVIAAFAMLYIGLDLLFGIGRYLAFD
jgi:hypothetical protein